jgi:hypothetical protein
MTKGSWWKERKEGRQGTANKLIVQIGEGRYGGEEYKGQGRASHCVRVTTGARQHCSRCCCSFLYLALAQLNEQQEANG